MKFNLKSHGGGRLVPSRNEGSFSMELIAIVVCVILVAVLGLRSFGGQISDEIYGTANIIKNITDDVTGRYDNSAPTDGLHRHGLELANGWCSDEGEDDYYERGVLIIYKNNSKYYMAQDDILVNGTYGEKKFVDGVLTLRGIEDDGSVLINETNFPDETFRNYVANNFDPDNNMKLSLTERNNVSSVDITDASLYNIKGVEYFPNLTALSAIGCQENCPIGEPLSVDLTWNTSLTDINLGGLNIEFIDISNNPKLKRLYLDSNQLTSLDISNNPVLMEVGIRNNNISSLNLASDSIAMLDVSENPLHEIDLSNMPKLNSLSLHKTLLETLDVSSNAELGYLQITESPLSTIILGEKNMLGTLYLDNNNLSELDLSKANSGYLSVLCNNNRLTNILFPEDENTLYELVVNNNNLGSIDVSTQKNLQILEVSNNGLNMIDISNNLKLFRLDISNNNIDTIDVSKNTVLSELNVLHTNIASLDLSKNKSLHTNNVKADASVSITWWSK